MNFYDETVTSMWIRATAFALKAALTEINY